MSTEELSVSQANALLNILTHHEAYTELRHLKKPDALAESGPPFKVADGIDNQSPLLQNLLSKCITTLPGLRDVDSDFWQAKCQVLIDDLAKEDLSESYEAGYVGIRKTLSTAVAAAVEGPARGFYGGLPKKSATSADVKYNSKSAEDVVAAYGDLLQGVVYGDSLDVLFAKCAETDRIEDHDPSVQAAHEYMLVIVASFMHYILVISPEGPTLFSLVKTANGLVPYTAIRQTLRIGNVATMINAMMRIVLAKLSLNTVTTFIGLTNASDSGMNLLQTIISTVVNWDSNQLKSKSDEIARKSNGLPKGQRELLDKYVDAAPEEREKCRIMSIAKEEPIVVTIVEEYGGEELKAAHISQALEYLSLEISIRDRQKICNILCSRQPDLLTQAIRDGVAAYDPVIRGLHNAVDLSGTVGDLGNFLQDLFALPISNSKDKKPPTVEDFVRLLRKHQRSLHKFIHQICKNGTEISAWYKDYAKSVALCFRVDDSDKSKNVSGGAGRLTSALQKAVSALSDKQRQEVLSECDAHAKYLKGVSDASLERMKKAIGAEKELPPVKSVRSWSSRPSSPAPNSDKPVTCELGPGVFLKRWQAYINETEISPDEIDGPLRHGGDESVVRAGRSKSDGMAAEARLAAARNDEVKPPKCDKVIELLAGEFRKILIASEKSKS